MTKIINIIRFEQEVYNTLGYNLKPMMIQFQRQFKSIPLLHPSEIKQDIWFEYSLKPNLEFYIFKN